MSMAQSKRKFFKTTFKVEVLSEETPVEWDNLSDVAYAITNGDCSGKITDEKVERLNAHDAALALQEQGSDPEFFQLDEHGNEVED